MMTLSKIAQLANVSVSTASKAFSMSHDISAETRNHVFAVARKYGCLRKFYKQEFYVPVVAVVCPEIKDEYSAVLSCICKCLDENKCLVSATTTNHSDLQKKHILEFYSRHSTVDAMIMVEHIGYPEMPHTSIFPFDYQAALEIGTDYLKREGASEIALAGWTEKELTECKEYCHFKGNDACAIVDAMIQNLPEAIICRNDALAVGIIRHLGDAAIKVPEQVKVMGMGNSSELQSVAENLTTIDFHIEENCRRAVCQVLKLMDGEACEELSLVPPELVKRETA